MTAEAKSAKRTAHLEMIDRLAESKDFMAFVSQALEEFCAYGQGYAEVDQFRQGVRAAGGWIVREISKSEKGRKALAASYLKHLTKINKRIEE